MRFDFKPHKTEVHTTLWCDRLKCACDTSTSEVSISTMNMHLNSIVWMKNSRFDTLDMKDVYLNSDLNDHTHVSNIRGIKKEWDVR